LSHWSLNVAFCDCLILRVWLTWEYGHERNSVALLTPELATCNTMFFRLSGCAPEAPMEVFVF